MLRKAILLAFCYYAFAVLISGCCNCPPQPEGYFRWTGLRLNNYSYTIQADSLVYSNRDSGTDFSSKNYELEVLMNYVLTSNYRPENFLIEQAYACKCAESTLQTSNPVVSLHVYAVNKYDNEHPSGSEITDRFGSPMYPKGIGPLNLPLNVLQYSGGPPYSAFELYMTKRPDSGTTQQFRVVATLLDSTSFTGLTSVLQF